MNNNKLNFNFDFLNSNEQNNSSKTNEINEMNNSQNNTEDSNFTRIRYSEDSNINWKPIIIISIILIVASLIGFTTHQVSIRNNNILQIKNTAYEFLKKGNESDCNSELNKLVQYNIDANNVKNELIQKYNNEKQHIISDIAYNYEHNKEQYQALKQKYLPQLFDNDENKFNQAIDEKLGYSELTLTKSPLPQSGIMKNYTGRKCIAPFRIESKNSEHTYIKLYDSISEKLALTIFVRAGETIQFDVPLGSYVLKSASGLTWYNEKNCFGHNTNYTKEDAIFDFKIVNNNVKGYTLSLIKVVNGNLRSIDIAPEDF